MCSSLFRFKEPEVYLQWKHTHIYTYIFVLYAGIHTCIYTHMHRKANVNKGLHCFVSRGYFKKKKAKRTKSSRVAHAATSAVVSLSF
jgi:hypothetical protein